MKPAKVEKPAKPARSSRPQPGAGRSAAAPAASAPAPQASAGKVTVCHRTGSAKNPYVQITISRNALAAHLRHGDPAPTGAACPSASATTEADRNRAHDKVTICHRTGSATNPYVVITIARAGWENGHSKHEGDRLLAAGDDPARLCAPQASQGVVSGPVASGCPATTETRAGVWHATGSRKNPFVFITPSPNSAHYDRSKHPDDRIVTGQSTAGVAAAACRPAVPAPAACPTTTTVEVPVGVWHATGSRKNPFVFITPSPNSAHYDRSKHPDDRIVTEQRTIETGTAACASAVPPTTPVSGAPTAPTPIGAGATAPAASTPPAAGVKAAAASGPARGSEGGVLGAAATLGSPVTRGTLPFTGLPLWLALLAGAGLVLTGVGLRRVRATA